MKTASHVAPADSMQVTTHWQAVARRLRFERTSVSYGKIAQCPQACVAPWADCGTTACWPDRRRLIFSPSPAALFAGRRAGITAAVLSAVVIWWAIDTHYFGQHVSALTRGVNRGLYATAAILVIWVADGYRCAGHARGPPAETAPARADTQASGTNGRAARRWLLPEGWHDRLVPNSLAAYGFAVAAVATA